MSNFSSTEHQHEAMFDTACVSVLTCLSFLTVCAFYGLSLAFLSAHLRLQYGFTLILLVFVLDMVDIGPYVWWSLAAGAVAYAIAEALISEQFRSIPLPVELTSYRLINNVFFLGPFLLVLLLDPGDDSAGLAAEVLVLLLLPCIWTLYTIIKFVQQPQFNYRRQLYFFWGLSLLAFTAVIVYAGIRHLVIHF